MGTVIQVHVLMYFTNKWERHDITEILLKVAYHWGKADDRNCNYGHPKMADVESGKNLFRRLNYFCNVF